MASVWNALFHSFHTKLFHCFFLFFFLNSVYAPYRSQRMQVCCVIFVMSTLHHRCVSVALGLILFHIHWKKKKKQPKRISEGKEEKHNYRRQIAQFIISLFFTTGSISCFYFNSLSLFALNTFPQTMHQ